MKNINYSILLNIFIWGILTVMLLTIFYATFLPNSKFLFFDESYLELLALEDTGGNGKLNLLTYPLTLYIICAFTCLQYLRTKDIIFINFLVIMWFAVLIARIVSGDKAGKLSYKINIANIIKINFPSTFTNIGNSGRPYINFFPARKI